MSQFGLDEARARFSQLVERAAGGEDVVIARNGRPVARLVPIATTNTLASVHGALRGRIAFDDLDDLPDDIAEVFGAK